MNYSYEDVHEACKKLVFFYSDTETIAKNICKYATNSDIEPTLVRTVAKFMNKLDGQGISCSLPYDVLYILLYDDTILSPESTITGKISEAKKSVFKKETERLKSFRKYFRNQAVGNSDYNFVRDGLSNENDLTAQQVTFRKKIIITILYNLIPEWARYFVKVKLGERHDEEETKNELCTLFANLLGAPNSPLCKVVPNPSYTNYLERYLTNKDIEEKKNPEFISIDAALNSDENGEPSKDAKEVQQKLSIQPEEITSSIYNETQPETHPVIVDSGNVMLDIRRYLSTSENKKELKKADFKKASVVATLVRRVVQIHPRVVDILNGKDTRTQLDWSYIISSYKYIRDKKKSDHLKKSHRLENSAVLILLKGKTFEVDIFEDIENFMITERWKSDVELEKALQECIKTIEQKLKTETKSEPGTVIHFVKKQFETRNLRGKISERLNVCDEQVDKFVKLALKLADLYIKRRKKDLSIHGENLMKKIEEDWRRMLS